MGRSGNCVLISTYTLRDLKSTYKYRWKSHLEHGGTHLASEEFKIENNTL